MKTYKEFVDKYGKRPADIVFSVSRLDALQEVGIWLESHQVSMADKWGNTIYGLWKSMPANPKAVDEWVMLLNSLKNGKIPE